MTIIINVSGPLRELKELWREADPITKELAKRYLIDYLKYNKRFTNEETK